MIRIFGEENLEDDYLTDEEPAKGEDAQPPQKRRRKTE